MEKTEKVHVNTFPVTILALAIDPTIEAIKIPTYSTIATFVVSY